MPFCPHCGKRIDHLVYWECSVNEANFYGDTYGDFETVDVSECGYDCPECGVTLFSDEEDARKFLKDDVEAQLKAMGSLKEE